jgi:hypothetical protein
MIQYYGTCNGTNPFNASIATAQTALTWMSGNVSGLIKADGFCSDDVNLTSSRSYIDDMNVQLGEFIGLMNCISITPQCQRYDVMIAIVYNSNDYPHALLCSLMEDGICTAMLTSLFAS